MSSLLGSTLAALIDQRNILLDALRQSRFERGPIFDAVVQEVLALCVNGEVKP